MRITALKWFVYAMFSIFIFNGCAGTKLTDTWVDKTYQGKPVSNILVIGLTFEGNEEVRQSFENRFVRYLKAAGVEAVSSMEAIPSPPDMKLKKEEILQVVKKYNNDAVLITHLIGNETRHTYTRQNSIFSSSDYNFYYTWAFDRRGYSRSSQVVRLATNLYDVETEKLIWSGQSKTMNPDSTGLMFNDVVQEVIKDLQKNNIILKNKNS